VPREKKKSAGSGAEAEEKSSPSGAPLEKKVKEKKKGEKRQANFL
jgi:hypothetical protein